MLSLTPYVNRLSPTDMALSRAGHLPVCKLLGNDVKV
jgi:hypothetical protein